MEDRELLEMAAKAAGIKGEWSERGKCIAVSNGDGLTMQWWRPLDDDGDALRLAAKCKLVVHFWIEDESVSVAKSLPNGDAPGDLDPSWEADERGDYRRVIVRAAAAIGKVMP